MNTVGKILVILNFLFAVIVGALLVVDVALRNQWKERYYQMLPEAKVMKDGRDNDKRITENIIAENKRLKIEFDQSIQKAKEDSNSAKALMDAKKVEIDELNLKLTDADTSLNQTKVAKQRLVDEIAILKTTITDREGLVVRLEADVKSFRLAAQGHESAWRDGKLRIEGLMDQLRDYGKKIAQMEGGVNPDRMKILKPNEPNPPTAVVNGKVLKVEGDLMEISLGTDAAVNKDNTLDVYRLQPRPLFLGTARVIDANIHSSVARFIPSGNTARGQLRAGDLVTSKLISK